MKYNNSLVNLPDGGEMMPFIQQFSVNVDLLRKMLYFVQDFNYIDYRLSWKVPCSVEPCAGKTLRGQVYCELASAECIAITLIVFPAVKKRRKNGFSRLTVFCTTKISGTSFFPEYGGF
jgi:hypothetical protein